MSLSFLLGQKQDSKPKSLKSAKITRCNGREIKKSDKKTIKKKNPIG
jgi:hypothetical protein